MSTMHLVLSWLRAILEEAIVLWQEYETANPPTPQPTPSVSSETSPTASQITGYAQTGIGDTVQTTDRLPENVGTPLSQIWAKRK